LNWYWSSSKIKED